VKAPPDNGFATAMAIAGRAMRQVLGDRTVWAQEAARTDAAPLPWPPADRVAGYPGLLRVLAITAVEDVLGAIVEAAAGPQPVDDPRFRRRLQEVVDALDPDDPDAQIVLRVVRRALAAADRELVRRLSGNRLDGKRDYHNWLKRQEVDAAIRSGMPRAEALRLLPLSRAAAYRAMKRG
jgi:hypothetical protein